MGSEALLFESWLRPLSRIPASYQEQVTMKQDTSGMSVRASKQSYLGRALTLRSRDGTHRRPLCLALLLAFTMPIFLSTFLILTLLFPAKQGVLENVLTLFLLRSQCLCSQHWLDQILHFDGTGYRRTDSTANSGQANF